MTLTLAIPTTLRSPTVVRAVTSALQAVASVPGAEVLVVLSGDACRRPRPPLEAPALRYAETAVPGAGPARNLALREARHETILFTDDDCEIDAGWVAALGRALRESPHAAVASPVAVPVLGPITAFLDYQQIFAAPPLDPNAVLYPITAGCGLRRDRLPRGVEFPERELPPGGAEDAELGYRLQDAGMPAVWLPSAPPVRHLLAEDADQIGGRFLRYGIANAALAQRLGRWRESVPGARRWYRSLLDADDADGRRFSELESRDARRCFALFEALTIAAFLAGYLDSAGGILGRELITLRRPQLEAGWRRLVEAAVAAAPPPPEGWADLRIDLGRLGRPTEPGPGEELAAVLHAEAPLTAPPEAAVAAELDRFAAPVEEVVAAAAARAEELRPALSADLSLPGLRRRLRAAALTYKDGLHDLELAERREAAAA